MKPSLWRALPSELLGTFTLIFVGAGAAALGLGGLLGAAFAHGGVVIGFIYAHGHLSGTHINPAVTLGFLVAGKIEAARAAAYVASQVLGGLLGALALRGVLGGVVGGLGATTLATDLEIGAQSVSIGPAAGFAIELILTFLLVHVVLNAAVSGKAGPLGGFAVGLTLVALILVGGPLTGASLNPARTLGPAFAAAIYSDLWLYLAGPLAGGAVAGLLYRGVLEER